MLDCADTHFGSRRCGGADDLDEMDAALAGLGLTPPVRYGVARNVVCGVSEQVSVRKVLDDEETGTAFVRRISRLIAAGIPVNLSPLDFSCEGSAIESWQRFCEAIRRALSRRGMSGYKIGLCIHAHQMPLEAYRLVADAVLGRGPRYVFLDSLQMEAHGNPAIGERARANWSFLWQQRNVERPVMPVYGGIVRSACPLLADEVAATVLPGTGLHAPINSAWLPITLPIVGFATGDGRIRWPALRAAIREAVAIAEHMHDLLRWPGPRQRADARQNRRLAIEVTGVGDLIARRGDDPTRLDCLKWLLAVMTRIRSELYEQSGLLAAGQGVVPALEQANHVSQWSAGPHRESWSRYWEHALKRSAVRHRNLLVLSPYSVIPARREPNAAYSDLLPIIGMADAWSFACKAEFRGWNVTRFRDFHRRARATIQQPRTASFIAAGP